MTGFHWTNIALPIGISFFTFQKISYLMDVYRGTNRPATKLHQLLPLRLSFSTAYCRAHYPLSRCGQTADRSATHIRPHALGDMAFLPWPGQKGFNRQRPWVRLPTMPLPLIQGVPDTGFAWLGILCYTFQIYFDFSGYSDMAIGLGRMLGFEYPGKLQRPLHCPQLYRVLETLAHLSLQLDARISLLPPWRQQAWPGQHHLQPVAGLSPLRHLARRFVELPDLGSLSRFFSLPRQNREPYLGSGPGRQSSPCRRHSS